MTPSHVLTFLLVCDDPALSEAVREGIPQPHRIGQYPRAGLINERQELSTLGGAIVDASARAHAVLAEWSLDRAPALNTLCYHVRSRLHAPVLMICPPDPEAQAAAIAAGADGTVSLPLSFSYLQAHVLSYHRLVQAVRATRPEPGVSGAHDVLGYGALRVDRTAHRFFVQGHEVELTPREFALIHYLITHAGVLCTREHILGEVWGITFDTGTNMVDVYMYFLRKKLEAHGLKGMIETVRGRGYRLVEAD